MRHLLPLPLALLLAAFVSGCAPDFPPASEVSGLRVLAIRAEPPEIAPAGDGSAPARAALDALVAHPLQAADPSRRATVIHLACTPVPGAPDASGCARLEALTDPAALLSGADLAEACAAPGRGRAGALTFAGAAACGPLGCEAAVVRRDPADPGSEVTLPEPAYELPPELSFSALPAGAAERVLGLEVTVIALALDAAPAELAPASAAPDACAALAEVAARLLAEWDLRGHVIALKRVRVRGPEALSPPNANPVISAVRLGGAALPPPGAPPAAIAGGDQDLLPALPGDPAALLEEYVYADSDGRPIETRRETWAFSWFGTAGEIDRLVTHGAGEADRYAPAPAGPALVWSVVRDLRGGTAWSAGALVTGP
ncbi:hypothetical protein AnaeK_1507 [Anaeromyxobacter sp. K]|uniref:hypothetical protein n=1 Tax=Anaeromyxobacter sp. (strain K) TaxID=447217 RepID=UPI00015F8ACA|nr:hypothetical protein [Anaeromyxobacter sp. K]ACG72737.1 hypothetical protein AnaeK_1507 [Anaeromyxobacter sp. K]